MLERARIQFDILRRLGDTAINTGLLAAMPPPTEAAHHLLRANLLRRCGDILPARDAFETFLGAPLNRHSATPNGLKSGADFAIAPVIIIDGLLPPEKMAALHRHACDIEDRFRIANVSSIIPERDPSKRDTLITYEFEYLREFFLGFVDENLAEFQQVLGLPPFVPERVEIKMTCHVDGGFFKTHSDNREPMGNAGRAITWLYYFGEDPPRHKGGELHIIDTDLGRGKGSSTWFTKVNPRPNRFVAFPSWFHHAVAPTRLEEGGFAAGRFAIGSHIRKPADGLDWLPV